MCSLRGVDFFPSGGTQGRRRGHHPGTALRPVPLTERRLLVKAHERGRRGEEHGRVGEQLEPAEEQRLPNDGRRHRQVHWVAHVPVQAADDESLGGRDGRRRPSTLADEPGERLEENGRTHEDQRDAGDAEREVWRRDPLVPARQEPRDQGGGRPWGEQEEEQGFDSSDALPHARSL